ncbi:uncharacterized protein LOC112576158 [Pomacea canaliculata]|uniref:uncharacterized protein LOC112576158 n=1 Tax=Pomacea canaliculata TaxID=400727 RepID=UPI000D73767B|nr:uncharacterized protein LOC112576158 [Pomacea canaliculata]
MDITELIVLVTLTLASPADSKHHSGSREPLPTLSTLQDALHALKMKTEALEEKLGDIESVVRTLQAFIKTMESNTGDMVPHETFDALEMIIQYYKENLKGKDVSFRATFKKEVTLIEEGIIKFDHVVTNEGDAYNASSGIFTAPVAADYIFGAQIITPFPSSPLHLELNVLGKNWHRIFKPGTDHEVKFLFFQNIPLAAGDTSFVMNKGPQNISATPESFFIGGIATQIQHSK